MTTTTTTMLTIIIKRLTAMMTMMTMTMTMTMTIVGAYWLLLSHFFFSSHSPSHHCCQCLLHHLCPSFMSPSYVNCCVGGAGRARVMMLSSLFFCLNPLPFPPSSLLLLSHQCCQHFHYLNPFHAIASVVCCVGGSGGASAMMFSLFLLMASFPPPTHFHFS